MNPNVQRTADLMAARARADGGKPFFMRTPPGAGDAAPTSAKSLPVPDISLAPPPPVESPPPPPSFVTSAPPASITSSTPPPATGGTSAQPVAFAAAPGISPTPQPGSLAGGLPFLSGAPNALPIVRAAPTITAPPQAPSAAPSSTTTRPSSAAPGPAVNVTRLLLYAAAAVVAWKVLGLGGQ